MSNSLSREEHLRILIGNLDLMSSNQQVIDLLQSDDVEQHPSMEGLEQCGIYELEELLLLGTDYVPSQDKKFNIQMLWENGGEDGTTTVTIQSGEHKVVITYDNNSDTLAFSSKNDETNELLKKYLIGRHVKLVY